MTATAAPRGFPAQEYPAPKYPDELKAIINDGVVAEERTFVRPLIAHYTDGHVEGIDEEGYGGFPGGLVDVTTKSGGNDFEGNIRSTMEHDALTGSNLVNTEIGTEVAGRVDVEGEARGPIVRNELFYFVSGKFVRQNRQALNHLTATEGKYSPIKEEGSEEKLFGKLTWNPGLTHSLELSAGYTNQSADNFELTGFEAEGVPQGRRERSLEGLPFPEGTVNDEDIV